MKKMFYAIALLLSVSLYSSNVYAVENQTNEANLVSETQTRSVETRSSYVKQFNQNGSFVGLTADGKVYVKGNNTQGQFGLGHYKYVANLTQLSFIKDRITNIEYSDYTLKLIVNNSKYYIAGRNAASYKNPAYNISLDKVFINGIRNTFVKVEGNLRTFYTSKDLTKVDRYAVKSGQTYRVYYFYPNGKVKQSYNVNYSNNIPTKIERTTYYTSGKFANSKIITSGALKRKREIDYVAINGRKKLVEDKYFSGLNRLSVTYQYGYDKRGTYMTNRRTHRYNADVKKIYYFLESYNSKGKRYYTYYDTYNPALNIKNGTTKTWFNNNGKITKKEITITGMTYYNQHGKSWAGKKCYVAPYANNLNLSGCMISSFAMINSKYSARLNPGQIRDKGLDCNFDYNKAASIFGYNMQNTWSTQGYTRNAGTSFANSSKLVPNKKSTYTIKEALEAHMPVQVWMSHGRSLHTGHSVVAYKYVYNNGKWDIKIYDPWTPNTPTRSLKDLASRWYITKAQIWVKK